MSRPARPIAPSRTSLSRPRGLSAAAALLAACGLATAPQALPQKARTLAEAFTAPAEETSDELTLCALVSNGMVLQRDAVVPVWGTGRPGAGVQLTTSWDPRPTRAIVENDGTWRLRIRTPPAGGPHALRFEMDGTVLSVEDVLSGEVWLASGQSNMEWKIAWIADAIPGYERLLTEVADDALRVFDVPNRISLTPEATLQGSWQPITAETWPNVSAVAYFFAAQLRETLDVPVGILSAEWGGTVAESWTGRSTLEAGFPEFQANLDRLAAAADGREQTDTLAARQAAWWANLAEKDQGTREGWQTKDPVNGIWGVLTLPGPWEEQGQDHDGVVWLRRTVEVPAAWAGRRLVLELGAIDDMDTAWFDGVRVGGLEAPGQWQTSRRYPVPAELSTAGQHTLAIRVVDTGGAGGVMDIAPLRLWPDGGDEAEALALSGDWEFRLGAEMGALGGFPNRGWFNQNQPTALFNGMIAPIAGYGLRGAIWYQGESNRMRAEQYERLFPAMIGDWRARWGCGDFPFLFVQIAPFRYGGDTGQAAALRDAQRKTLATPATGMAVTMDIGNPADIHPKRKREVGRRLALWARALAYGEAELDVSGPLLREVTAETGALRVHFDHADEGLVSRLGDPSHLELAGEDGVFHPAQGTIDGATLLVSSPEVARPVAVRYGWGAADEPNLFDKNGLPASSFQGRLQTQ